MARESITPDERLVRKRVILSLLVITPLGFLLKLYVGPGQRWVNNSAVGVAYVVFWCLVVFFAWPRRRYAGRIALIVLAFTCLLEVLQLWHPPLLEQIRDTFLGRALLGTTFGWQDFVYYVLGTALGWFWMRWISR
jgi:hypothetical protein